MLWFLSDDDAGGIDLVANAILRAIVIRCNAIVTECVAHLLRHRRPIDTRQTAFGRVLPVVARAVLVALARTPK